MPEHFNYCLIYELELNKIIYDARAKDGTWCTMPYKSYKGDKQHLKGCPEYPKCINKRIDWMDINTYRYRWFSFVRKFSILDYALFMKNKNSKLTDNQCRCVLYYQKGINKTIKDTIKKWFNIKDFNKVILLDRPEANGINVYSTMSKHGLNLKANYDDIIYKMMFVGLPSLWSYEQIKLGV